MQDQKLVIVITRGLDDERSSVAWSIANAGIASGLEVTVFLAASGVDWVRKGAACAIATSRGRTHESSSESRMREIRTSGLTSGSVETEHGSASEAPANERAGQQIGRT